LSEEADTGDHRQRGDGCDGLGIHSGPIRRHLGSPFGAPGSPAVLMEPVYYKKLTISCIDGAMIASRFSGQ
jgi:hypothetical protein